MDDNIGAMAMAGSFYLRPPLMAAFQPISPPPPPPPMGGGAPIFGGESPPSGGGTSGEAAKRKRGRPRKYGPDGNAALPLLTENLSNSGSGNLSNSGSLSCEKRRRGRPPGTGRKQQLALHGEWVSGSAGMGFTPHVITIQEGEDIATKIMSFSQQGPRAVCILSATGAVSAVTLRQSEASGGSVTYQGHFEIICLSGSYILSDDGESQSRSGGLSICLSSGDGRIIAGGVGGFLRAATSVQVIVGSFNYAASKTKQKANNSNESGAESDLQTGDKQSSLSSSLPNPSLPPSPVLGGWAGSKQLDIRNSHMDMNFIHG